jgi:16S rRNA (guanine966-N2)-methyltransferase
VTSKQSSKQIAKPAAKSPNGVIGAQRVRIIGGTHRSRWVKVADAPGLRPTPDRVRETLFNWLGQNLAGQRCLDLFAGSGGLTFEAASRGAFKVIAVESNGTIARALREQSQQLQFSNVAIHAGDAMVFLANELKTALKAAETYLQFDVIFIDPPYASQLQAKALSTAAPLLAPDARVYVEADRPISGLLDPADATLARYEIVREAKAGAVHYALLQFNSVQINPDQPAPAEPRKSV